MAKRTVKKLSTKKLEDRIAPAMIAGVLEGAEAAVEDGLEPVEAPPEPIDGDAGWQPEGDAVAPEISEVPEEYLK